VRSTCVPWFTLPALLKQPGKQAGQPSVHKHTSKHLADVHGGRSAELVHTWSNTANHPTKPFIRKRTLSMSMVASSAEAELVHARFHVLFNQPKST